MSILYFDNECKEGLTLQEVNDIREKALRLTEKSMHPRYQFVINDLFKAANALANEMKFDDMRSDQNSV